MVRFLSKTAAVLSKHRPPGDIMAGQTRPISTSELESLLFYTVRYALNQEIVAPEVVTLVERHASHISAPMMQELGSEISQLLPGANLCASERRVWEAVSELLIRNSKKKKRNGRCS